jgi:predicted phage tail protein
MSNIFEQIQQTIRQAQQAQTGDTNSINESSVSVDSSSSNLTKEQYAIVYDLISEGEIEGLVQGPASVFLNDVPLMDEESYQEKGAQGGDDDLLTGTVSQAGTSLSITGNLKTNDQALGRRVIIEGAGKTASGITFTGYDNSKRLTASSAFFEDGMVMTNDPITQTQKGTQVQIEMENGEIFTSLIAARGSDTAATLNSPLPVGGTYSATINLVTSTSAPITSNTITLSDAAVTAVTNAPVVIGSGITLDSNFLASTVNEDSWNFKGSSANFMTGTTTQDYLSTPSESSSASYLYSLEQVLNKTNDFAGGTQSPVIITPTNFQGANAEDIDKFKLFFSGPSLVSISGNTGREYTQTIEIRIQFQYEKPGSTLSDWITVIGRESPTSENHPVSSGSIRGMTKKPYVKEFRFNVEQFQPFVDWKIRVSRAGRDSGEVEHYNQQRDLTLKAVEAQVLEKLNYRGSAYAAVTYSAKDFRSPPNRTYLIRGKKILVPTNYITREENDGLRSLYKRNVTNGTTESSEQTWDGNFRGDLETATVAVNKKKVYCNNPAWVFYDILTNPIYGLGDFIDKDVIDKYSLYQIAQYCDELVPDGEGGQEPRFTCNVYFSSGEEAYKVLKDLATVFRGIMYWINGQVVAVQDSPKESVFTFTQGNVVNGLFNYEGQSDRVSLNRVNVSYSEPDKSYSKEVVTVDNLDNIVEKNRVLTQDIVAFGCTSRGQAIRAGKWYLETNARENEIIKFETGSNGSFIVPGDIISVQDQEKDLIQFSGRVSNTGTRDTDTVPLDRDITLQTGSSYVLHVYFAGGAAYLNQPSATIDTIAYTQGQLVTGITSQESAADKLDDSGNRVAIYWSEHGHIQSKSISTAPNNTPTSSIEVSPAFTSIPEPDSVWAITTDGGAATESSETINYKQYRVLSIEESDNEEYSIIGALYDTAKFSLVDYGYPSKNNINVGDPNVFDTNIPAPSQLGLRYALVDNTDTDSGEEDENTPLSSVAVGSWVFPEKKAPTEQILGTTTIGQSLKKYSKPTDLQVVDTTDFYATGGVAAIRSSEQKLEYISYTGKATSPVRLTGIRRAYYGTPSCFWDSGATIESRESITTTYNRLRNFEVKLEGEGISPIFNVIDGNITTYRFKGLPPGTYVFSVRATNSSGLSGPWAQQKINLLKEKTLSKFVQDRVSTFGLSNKPFVLSSSAVAIESGLLIQNPSKEAIAITQTGSVSFSGMIPNTTAYLYYDHSASELKAVEVQKDTTWYLSDAQAALGGNGVKGSFSWFSPLGDTNKGLTRASGNAQILLGSNKVEGKNVTSFTTDYSVGDLIKFSTVNTPGTFTDDAWYSRIESIESDTVMYTETVSTKDFDTPYSNQHFFKQTLAPKSSEDLLLAKIVKNGVGAESLETLVAIAANETITNSSINYSTDGSGNLPVDSGGTGFTDQDDFSNEATDIQGTGIGTDYTTTVQGRKISVNNSSGNFWGGGWYSKQGSSEALKLSFKPDQINKGFVVGINDSPATSGSYSDINYGFYMAAAVPATPTTGALRYAKSSGTFIDFSPAQTYTAEDTLDLIWDGSTISFLKNGDLLLKESYKPTATQFVDISWGSGGEYSISNVEITPFVSVGSVISTGGSQTVAFNKNSDGIAAPRRSSAYQYAYSSTRTYSAGLGNDSLDINGDTYLENTVEFFEGSTKIASFDFLHIVDYGLSASTAYETDKVRSFWKGFTGTGTTAADFTVSIGSDNNRVVWDSSTTGVYDLFSANNYGGDAVSYNIIVTHTESGIENITKITYITVGGTTVAIK